MDYIPMKTGEEAFKYECAVCNSTYNTVHPLYVKSGEEVNYFVGACTEHVQELLHELRRMEDEWQRELKEWRRRMVSLDKVRYTDAEGNPVTLMDTIPTRPAHKTIDGPNDNVKGIVRRLYCKFGWGRCRITQVVQRDYGLAVAERTIGYYLQELKAEGVKPGGYIKNPLWVEGSTVPRYTRWKKPDYTTKLEQQAKAQEQREELIPFTLIPENTKPPKDGNEYTKAEREGKDYLLKNIKYATVTNQM